MAYTTQANIEAFLQRDLTASEEAILTMILASIDAFINSELDGDYGSEETTTKYYDGGSRIIDIDACSNITAVNVVDDEELVTHEYEINVDYEARPRNDSVKNYLERRRGTFPAGVANIAVTATFGLGSTVPSDITLLATYLAGNFFRGTMSSTGNLKSESIEGYSRTFKEYSTSDEFVMSILNKYTSDDMLL